MKKNEISAEEYKRIIDEIVLCHDALSKRFDEYVANSISRLIDARIKLALSTIKHGKALSSS